MIRRNDIDNENKMRHYFTWCCFTQSTHSKNKNIKKLENGAKNNNNISSHPSIAECFSLSVVIQRTKAHHCLINELMCGVS